MSRGDFVRRAKARLVVYPVKTIDPAAIDKKGSNVNVFYNGIAAMCEEVDRRSAQRFAAKSLDAAEDEDLSAYVAERSYGRVVRKGAAKASVDLYVTRPTTAGTLVIPEGAAADVGGVSFLLDAPGVTFAPGEGGPLVRKRASFTSKGTGLATNAVVTAPRFSPAQANALLAAVTDTDPEPQATGGAEREGDAALKARFKRDEQGRDNNTTLLEAGALSTPGVESAVAIEEINPEGLITGQAILHVADANGRAGKSLRASVTAQLRDYRMLGQWVTVLSALPALTPITASFGVLAGFSIGDVQTRARNAILASVNALEPGESLLRARLAGALQAVPGVAFLPGVPFGVTVPAADLIAAFSTRFRTAAELVTFA